MQSGATINTSKLVEDASKASGTPEVSALSDRDEDALGDVSQMIEENDSTKSITGGVSLPSVEDPINKDSAKSEKEGDSGVQSAVSQNDEVSMTVSPDNSSLMGGSPSQKSQDQVELGSDTSDVPQKSTQSGEQDSFGASQTNTSVRSGASGQEQESVASQSAEQLDEASVEQKSGLSQGSQISVASESRSVFTPQVSAKSVISEFGQDSQDVDQDSVKSGESIKQMLSDEDTLEETLDDLSKKEDNLEDQLSKLEQMSNVGQLDEEGSQDQKSTASGVSEKSASFSPMTIQKDTDQLSDESNSVDIEEDITKSPATFETESLEASPVSSTVNVEEVIQKSQSASEQFSEPIVGMDRSHVSGTSERDIDTVITDENNKPLTEQDKEIILDELEGKSAKADLHINHKSIESLHHINVYHYLPPKFIAASSMPYGYPGMPQQQQPMTPGPIINIHNSTTSSGGGTNNAYDVGPDGKLHAMDSGPNGQVVVSNPTPTQNWGQVVYSNNHHGVHAGAVSTISQPPVGQANNLQTQLPVQTQMDSSANQMMNQPLQTEVNQTPLTIESTRPNVINEEPIIESQDIKMEPIVNSEVINKSPVNVFSEEQTQQSAISSEVSSSKSGDQDQEIFVNQSQGALENSKSEQSLTSGSGDFSPSQLSDFDEETVEVDPSKVNDENGQSVTLGEEQSEKSLDDKSILII